MKVPLEAVSAIALDMRSETELAKETLADRIVAVTAIDPAATVSVTSKGLTPHAAAILAV